MLGSWFIVSTKELGLHKMLPHVIRTQRLLHACQAPYPLTMAPLWYDISTGFSVLYHMNIWLMYNWMIFILSPQTNPTSTAEDIVDMLCKKCNLTGKSFCLSEILAKGALGIFLSSNMNIVSYFVIIKRNLRELKCFLCSHRIMLLSWFK